MSTIRSLISLQRVHEQRTIEDRRLAFYIKKIGPVCAAARARHGWSLPALAERLCVSAERVRRWEKGTQMPSLPEFWSWLFVLDITLTFTAPPTVCRFCQTVVASPDAIRPPSA